MVDLNIFMTNFASKSYYHETLQVIGQGFIDVYRTSRPEDTTNSNETKTLEQIAEESVQAHFKLQARLADGAKEVKSEKLRADEIRQRLSLNYYDDLERQSLTISRQELEKKEPSENEKQRIVMGQIRLMITLNALMDCYQFIEDKSYLLDTCVDIFELLGKTKKNNTRPTGWLPFIEKVVTQLRKQSNFRKYRHDLPISFHRLCHANLDSPIVRTIYIEELLKPGAKNSTIGSRVKSMPFEPRDFMFVKDWLTKTPYNICFSIYTEGGDNNCVPELAIVLEKAILEDRVDYDTFDISFAAKNGQIVKLWSDHTLKKFMFNLPVHSAVVTSFPLEKADVAALRIAHSVYFNYVLPMLGLGLPPYVICWIVEWLVPTKHYPHFHGIKLIEKMRDARDKILTHKAANKKKKFVIELSK